MSQHLGFDAARECASVVDLIPDDVDFCARYFSHNPRKNLSAKEAIALCDADLRLVTVWETTGTHRDFFSAAQGGADAVSALALARQVGQPERSAIYFAVDYDASLNDLNAHILPYFDRIAGLINAHYDVGVYGSGLVCGAMLARGIAKYAWLGGATGWRGSRSFASWHIKQALPADPYGFGWQIDPNVSRDDEYGGFMVGD